MPLLRGAVCRFRDRRALGWALVVLCGAWAIAAPSSARGNGAFPDSQSILLPPDRPSEIVLATNFGLIFSEDGGSTWEWTCETLDTSGGRLYQVGPPPRDRLFTVTLAALAYSDDGACTWQTPAASPGNLSIIDAFLDRAVTDRVLAVMATRQSPTEYTARISTDGGTTFGAAIFTAPVGLSIKSIESARSAPDTIYLTMDANPSHPRLVRTSNGGRDWETVDLAPAVGTGFIQIISVDPNDANRLLLRVLDVQQGDRVLLSLDGGRTVREVARAERRGYLTGFLRRADGTLLLGGDEAGDGLVLSSRDRGETWFRWGHPPHPRAFGERGGKLYLVGDNVQDGFAVAISDRADEDGSGLTPIVRLESVSRMKACVADSCRGNCAFEVARGNLSPQVCGPGFDGAAPDGPRQSGGLIEVPDGPGTGGCRCEAGARPSGSPPLWVGLILALVGLRALRRRAPTIDRNRPREHRTGIDNAPGVD
jgi:hypothetical protein